MALARSRSKLAMKEKPMDRPAVIRKTEQDLRVAPHLADYEGIRRGYSWAGARQALAGLPGGALNIAYEAVDRHAQGPLRERIALRFVASEAPAIEISFAELARLTSRFANVLRQLGVRQGRAPVRPGWAHTGTVHGGARRLKCGVVVTPLFSALPALLHFTSGTTGTPKGAVHVHAPWSRTTPPARYALDLHEDDVFWCTADPGWVTGTSYGIIAPLCTA
jgi:hypothetical protein